MMNSSGWHSETAKTLQSLAKRISAVPKPQTIGPIPVAFERLRDDAEDAIAAIERTCSACSFIYIIALDDEASPESLKRAFEAFKVNGKMSLPRENPGGRPPVLYVGSVCGTSRRRRALSHRLRQHLLEAPQKTYALNLSRWAVGQAGGVLIYVYAYTLEITREIIGAIEDYLSSNFQPMLGRRGHSPATDLRLEEHV
jgi:hypothetical protein